MLSRIVSVTPKENFCIEIVLDNGNSINLDFKSRLHTVRFSMLSDKEYFGTVTTDGTCVRWNNRIEISLSEVLQLEQKQMDKRLIQTIYTYENKRRLLKPPSD